MAYYCKLALLIIYEPQHAFTLIKRRRARTSLLVPILLLVLCMAVHLARIYITHYPLAASTPEDANLANELLSLMLPLLSFTVGLYLVTTIRDGETTFRETLTAVAYSMVPYILLTLPIALVSNIMTLEEQGLFQAMQTLVLGWCILLILYSVMHMNSYSLAQTIFIALMGIFAILFVWAVLFLLYILGDKLISFIMEVVNEYRMAAGGI